MPHIALVGNHREPPYVFRSEVEASIEFLRVCQVRKVNVRRLRSLDGFPEFADPRRWVALLVLVRQKASEHHPLRGAPRIDRTNRLEAVVSGFINR